jgi:hypothetical protein
MSEPHIIELPDRQGVIPSPDAAIMRFHDSGQYLFPFGTTETWQADFGCPNCGHPVRWVMIRNHTAVLVAIV